MAVNSEPSVTSPAGARASAGRRARAARLRDPFAGFLLTTPALVLFAAFFVLPNALNFAFAFTDWSTYSSDIHFIGLENFRELWRDGSLTQSLETTLLYGLGVMVVQNTVALLLALGLERDTPWNRVLRVAFFVPLLIGPLAVGYIWRGILAQNGILNHSLGRVLGHAVTTQWLGSLNWTILVVVGIHAWRWCGFSMLVYLAGLKTIPEELIESARVEGASPLRTLWHIKLPLMAPAFTFSVVITLVGAMNTFDIIQATTAGGPGNATRVVDIYMFQQFGSGLLGSATAMGLVLFLTVAIVGLPLVYLLRRREVQL
jgi:raffinose/stachyose/melibiose transport system permease protein